MRAAPRGAADPIPRARAARSTPGTGGSSTPGTGGSSTPGTGGSSARAPAAVDDGHRRVGHAGTGGSGGGTAVAAVARRPAAAARAEAARRVAAAPRAPAVEAAAAPAAGTAGTGTAGTGGTGTGGSGTGVTVNLGATRQTIEGFGLNTALSSAVPNWDMFYTATGSGLGLSIVRVAMQSNGSLSGAVPPASYNAKVIGSPWTAPANYKDNNNTQKGGHLLTSCTTHGRRRSPTLPRTTSSTRWGRRTSPTLRRVGPPSVHPATATTTRWSTRPTRWWTSSRCWDRSSRTAGVKLIAPEPSEWIHLWSNASATGSTVAGHPNSSDPLKCGCFSNTPTTTGCASKCATGDGYDYGHFLAKDATAWGLIDIIGTHEYDTQKAEAWPSDVDGGKRSKPIYETEVSGVHYWPNEGPSSDIANGVVVAEWIHSALVVGEASAWLYWWYQASGDNEGLIISTSSLTKRAYTLGNYAKFVRPGYVMVDVTGNSNASLLLSAFKGTDGTVAVVAVNKGTSAATVPITIAGGTAPASCTPNVTSSSANLAAGTAVTVTGGTFTASLAATTVTTFVCKVTRTDG